MEEDVPTDQQLGNQERNSSSDQEDPELPQIKEEQEELCSSQDVKELVLKQETENFMLIPTNEENDHSEPEPSIDQQLCDSSTEPESQNQEGCKHVDSGSTINAEPEPKKTSLENTSHGNRGDKIVSKIHCESQSGEKSFECGFCGKTFCRESKLNVHVRLHTGETPFVCKTCGKGFRQISALNTHLKIHTGKKPYSCKTCGKGFLRSSNLLVHQRTHTGEKPYSCETCGKGFTHRSNLMVHLRTHTGERPYCCEVCGTRFIYSNELTVHMRSHTGEKPYSCDICGERFSGTKFLRNHMKIHTGETSYYCETWETLDVSDFTVNDGLNDTPRDIQ